MIKGFKNALTEDVFNGVVRKDFPADLIKTARRKLNYLAAAASLDDLLRLQAIALKRSRVIAWASIRSV